MPQAQHVGTMHIEKKAKKSVTKAKDRRRRIFASAEDRPRAKMGRNLIHPLWNTWNLDRGVKR